MLLLFVAKRKTLPFFTAAHHQTLNPIPTHRFYSSAALASGPNFLADHLVTSWSFSPNKAAIISKRFPSLKSPDKPDAVLGFLTHHGFAKADIETLTLWQPSILYSSPDNTLAPNLRALRDIGLSTSALTRIILSGPAALYLRSAVPRIKFWKDFIGGSDEAPLVRAITQNRGLIGCDIKNNIAPKISFLQGHGLSAHDIRRTVVVVPQFMTRNIASMEILLNRAKELGFRTESGGMFVLGLHALSCVPREAFQRKMELFKSFGWSEDEFLSTVLKAPAVITLSEGNLRAKMEFLVGEVSWDPSYIASHRGLLTLSLEKRLRPRYHVLRLLESKGLLSGKRAGFYSATNLSDIKFVERYILPHEKEIPELQHFGKLIAA